MHTQWQCLIKNCGVWQGQFQQYSPTGEPLSGQPSVVTLQLTPDGKTMRQTVQVGDQTRVLEYASLGRSVAFFANGAFSQGSTQFTPVGEFGAELGLIHGGQRLRAVVLYDQGKLTGITLIPEHLPDHAPIDPSPLTAHQLQGQWRGETTEIYPDGNNPKTYSHERQGFSAPDPMLYLPHHSALAIPHQIINRSPFSLSLWWLADPRTLYRMERGYDGQGGWSYLRLTQASPQ
jgi:hypothetical protein